MAEQASHAVKNDTKYVDSTKRIIKRLIFLYRRFLIEVKGLEEHAAEKHIKTFVIQRLHTLSRQNMRRILSVPRERQELFDRQFDRKVNPVDAPVPKLLPALARSDGSTNTFMLVKKPVFKPRPRPQIPAENSVLAKPELKLDNRTFYRLVKLSQKPQLRAHEQHLLLERLASERQASAMGMELGFEGDRFRQLDWTNMIVLGQNSIGATSNTTKFAVVQQETAGEIEKPLGIGLQDLNEARAESNKRAVLQDENNGLNREHGREDRAELRHIKTELRELQLEQDRLLQEQLQEMRKSQHAFKQQHFAAKHRELARDMDEFLLEAEMRQVVQNAMAAPAA